MNLRGFTVQQDEWERVEGRRGERKGRKGDEERGGEKVRWKERGKEMRKGEEKR